MAEILFKVGDSGGYKDGQVIAIKPDGWLLSAADMKAWTKDGKEPTVLADMPQYLADQLRRRISRLRYYLSHTPAEIAAEFGINVSSAALDKTMAETDRDWMVADGFDTNWGRSDLKIHYIVRIADLTQHDWLEFIDEEANTDHLRRSLAKRRYRVEYEAQFDAAKLTDIRNKDLRLAVDRTGALARSVVKATTVK